MILRWNLRTWMIILLIPKDHLHGGSHFITREKITLAPLARSQIIVKEAPRNRLSVPLFIMGRKISGIQAKKGYMGSTGRLWKSMTMERVMLLKCQTILGPRSYPFYLSLTK